MPDIILRTANNGDIPLSHAFKLVALPDGSVMLDLSANGTDDGAPDSYYRALTDVDFTGLAQVEVESIRSLAAVIGAEFKAFNDPLTDTYATVAFEGGVSGVTFGTGSAPADTRVGRIAAAVFGAQVGLIRADELGGSGKNSAYHLARANHTGTQLAATISDFAAAVAATPPASHVHSATDITSGLLALARGGTGADNSSQTANLVFASPGSGGAGAASWRALVAADIPNLDAAKITTGALAKARQHAQTAYLDAAATFVSNLEALNFIINGAAGTSRDMLFRTGGVNRWIFRCDATAETGSNAGSNWLLNARDDAGAQIGNAISITRATLAVLFGGAATVSGTATLSGQLKHAGSTAGFYNVTPVARPAALTQTYATATRTHAARTAAALTDSIAGTIATTLAALPDPADSPATADALRDDLVANLIPKLRNALSSLADQVNKLIADQVNTAQFTNTIADDLQLLGLEQ